MTAHFSPWIPAAILFALLALVAILRSVQKPAGLPYVKNGHFLSPAERSFFGVLQTAFPDFHIFAKVRFLDLLTIPKGTQNRQAAQNRVIQKHVDFVLCSKDTVDPRVVIELDDKSHRREDRQKRDALVDEICKVAGLPIVHIDAKRAYSPGEVSEAVRAAIGKAAAPSPDQAFS